MQRLSILPILFLGLLCGCASPGTTKPASIQSYPLSAEDLDFAVALARYSAGVAEEIHRGPTKGRSADFFLDAAAHDPGNPMLARKASIALLYQRRSDEAAQVLESASSLNPTNYSILLDLAKVYNIGDQAEKRVEAYRRAMKLEPSEPAAYLASARNYLAEGRIDEALPILEEGAKRSDAQLMSDLALINAAALLQGGFPDRSIAWFEFTAAHSKANKAQIHVILADLFEGKGARSKSLEHYEKALRSPNPMPETFVKMAMIVGETDLESALMILDRGEARFPMHSLILTAIVYIADTHNAIAKAITVLERIEARAIATPTADFYLHLGSAADKISDIKTAETSFQKGLKAHPDSAAILNNLAYMWAEKGMHLDEGEKMVKRALELEPDSAAYLDTLGWIYYMQGKNKDAHDLITQALAVQPKDPAVLDHLGDILAKQGRINEAIAQWKKSYLIDASNEAVKHKLAEHSSPAEKDQKK